MTILAQFLPAVRVLGFRQFLRRGLERVSQEWTLICLAHNLLKLYGATAKA